MTLNNWRHYLLKLIANSTRYKFISASIVSFIGIINPDEYIIFHILMRLWVASMIFWTWNWVIKNGFSMRKFCMWWAKIVTYWVLIYFAKALELVTHLWVRIDVFTWFMIFELLLSIFKHCAELGIPVPTKLMNFVKKQEQNFEEKFMNTNK